MKKTAKPKARVKAKPAARKRAAKKPVRSAKPAKTQGLSTFRMEDVDELRAQLESTVKKGGLPRWNADPDDVQRSVAKLVLTLVEFIRKLLERQAIRRMDEGTLTPKEVEAIGSALMKLEQAIGQLAEYFGVPLDELNLELGPLGKLM